MTAPTTTRQVGITEVQGRVLRELMHDGATNAQIGARLGMTVDSVKYRIGELLWRTGCANRTALAIALLRDRITVYLEQP